jgi:DNA-binding MarR family transcriptional regulator
MHRQTSSHLAPRRLTADQFVLLALLAEQDGITQRELARRAASDPNTIRAMLILLENRGLVARRPHPHDGRARSVKLTRKGRRACDRLWAQIRPLQRRLSSLFDDNEAEALLAFLDRISEAMAEPERKRDRPRSVTSAAANS